jgi:uncharacterized protein
MSARVAIDLGTTAAGSVSGLRYDPASPATARLVLAHGAGANQEHPFIVTFATGLAARGIAVLTFNFPYTEAHRRAPDRPEVLLACFRAVVAFARAHLRGHGPLLIGGKSLGGRMASHLAADGEPDVAGLLCLGYPLHPPGRPEQLRVKHLPRIAVPVLIVQGARDVFGTPEELSLHTSAIPGRVTLEVVEGGDHSFKQPKKVAPDPRLTFEHLLDSVAAWTAGVPPVPPAAGERD